MIETTLRRTCRVTCITARAVVNIPAHPTVIIIHFRFIAVLVAADTGELRITCRIGMAIGTTVPFSLVCS